MNRRSFEPRVSPDDQLPAGLVEALSEQFDIGPLIGKGGMATVWLAHRKPSGLPVALKVLRPALAYAIGSQRFIREIRIASEVRSPGLIPLEESGEALGLPYYVMPLADAGSLRQRIEAENQLSLKETIQIAMAVATGLAELHRNGFVHRDVKPENVLLTTDGRAMLADYGIARMVSGLSSEALTSAGVVLGTPAYMSPEQGSGGFVDARSDQYSWGCVVYEMLAGAPPFHASSPIGLVARHIHEPPPPIHVVRSSVPAAVEAIVMRTLAKSAADRFADVDEVIAALSAADVGASTTASVPTTSRKSRRMALSAVAVMAVAVSAAAGAWRYWSGPPLDASRVIVFPLADVDSARSTREGQDLALLIGSALERAQATNWIDGVSFLDDHERQLAGGVGDRRARSVARDNGARYYLTGFVQRRSDSVRVQIALHDAADGSTLAHETESGASGAAADDLTLRAVVRVLPKLTGLDRVVDVSGLTGHRPDAVHDWLLGEREYRRSNMTTAFQYLERAVKADSLLAPAAFRAAVAAAWINRPDTAGGFIHLALRHQDGLSQRQGQYARAFERFLVGRANEAMVALRGVGPTGPESADEWMLAGEIQLHLLPLESLNPQAMLAIPAPTLWPLEARAEDAFTRARGADPAYSPPLAHLAEIAARRGDADGVARISKTLMAVNPDSTFSDRMGLTERCLRRGGAAVDWRGEARKSTRNLFRVGADLVGSTSNVARRCAESAFGAVLAADTTQGPDDWSSLLALHSMLVADGQPARAVRLVDSAVTRGLSAAMGLYVVDAAAGLDPSPKAAPFVDQLYEHIDTRAAPSLWLMALWEYRERNVERLARVHDAALAHVRANGTRLDTLMEAVTGVYLAAGRGDTTLALRELAALQPTASHQLLYGALWEALAPERILYARLLLARGNASEAHRIASTFDQPEVVVHQLFLPASLDVRVRAARALGDTVLERRARQRMESLVKVPVQP